MSWSRIAFIATLIVVANIVVLFAGSLVSAVALWTSGLGLFARLFLASVSGLVLFGIYYRPVARWADAQVDRSEYLPIHDTAAVARIVATVLSTVLPVLCFAVLSTLSSFLVHERLVLATVALCMAWTLTCFAAWRGYILSGIYFRKHPEDKLTVRLKRGETFTKAKLDRVLDDLAREKDGDMVRIRLRRLKQLIRYIEDENLDPDAEKRKTLAQATLSDLAKRAAAAELTELEQESRFRQDRLKFKRRELKRRRKERSEGASAIEEALRDWGNPRRERDFDEVGGDS